MAFESCLCLFDFEAYKNQSGIELLPQLRRLLSRINMRYVKILILEKNREKLLGLFSRNLPTLALMVVLIIVVISSGAQSQITFSRDWLAGSGKRSPAYSRGWLTSGKRTKVPNYSRDWLTSGKRSVPMSEDSDETRDLLMRKIIQDLNGLDLESNY